MNTWQVSSPMVHGSIHEILAQAASLHSIGVRLATTLVATIFTLFCIIYLKLFGAHRGRASAPRSWKFSTCADMVS